MLSVSRLSGFGSNNGRFEAPNFSLVDATSGTYNTNSKTFSNLNFGDTHSSRYLIAGFHAYQLNSLDGSFSVNATIGGISASVYYNIFAYTEAGSPYGDGLSRAGIAGFAIANVPNETIGDVSFVLSSYSGTMTYWGIGLYRAVGLLSATPTANGDGDNNSVTMNVPANGFGLIAASSRNLTITLTNNTYLVNAYNNNHGLVCSKSVSGSQQHGTVIMKYATWTFET